MEMATSKKILLRLVKIAFDHKKTFYFFDSVVSTFPLSFIPQSLQNKSYNHFAAIYYLLVERLKAHRCSFPVEQRLDARQRRPSTIAEQTVVKVRAEVSKAPGEAYTSTVL